MCNDKYAAYVKINAPYELQQAHFVYVSTPYCNYVIPIERSCRDLRFCLTNKYMRRSYYYIFCERYPDDQTSAVQRKDTGVEAHGHAQSTPRDCDRSHFQRESILRFQGSSPGSLRDAAAAQCRREVRPRCGRSFWGFAAHLLSDASSLQPIRPGRLVAESTRAQRRAQGDSRSPRLCSESEGGSTWVDHGEVCLRHSRTLWNCDPSSHSRASFGAGQKKTTRSDRTLSIPEDAVAVYETLRPHLVGAADYAGSAASRAVLLRRGMLAWACECKQVPASQALLRSQAEWPVSSEVTTELVQLMAGMILGSGKDSRYA